MINIQILKFIGFWLISSLLIWITAQISPRGLILGNQNILPAWACVFAGYILSPISILIKPVLKLLKLKTEKQLEVTIALIVINSVCFWIITRLALIIGVGIPSFWWAGIEGTILALGQMFVIQIIASLTPRTRML